VVFAVGDHVVKLHEPWNRGDAEVEAECLDRLEGALAIATPRLVARGELEGWSYLVMTRLPGQPLSEVRAEIAPAEWPALCAAVGRLAIDLQAVPVAGPLAGTRPWAAFVAEQRAGCAARHRRLGLPEALLGDLERRLAGIDLAAEHPVLLHTELTDTNLMVVRERGRWRLAGVFDFEPAMVGHPHYDLPAITIFVARGRPDRCRAALAGYGIAEPDPALRARLLALTLLHRYSRLDFFLAQVGVDGYPGSWDEIATRLFGW
jgi:hygromycin-B 7''-O-kinase